MNNLTCETCNHYMVTPMVEENFGDCTDQSKIIKQGGVIKNTEPHVYKLDSCSNHTNSNTQAEKPKPILIVDKSNKLAVQLAEKLIEHTPKPGTILYLTTEEFDCFRTDAIRPMHL